MAIKNQVDLESQADVIKNETIEKANTASRVGQMIVDFIQSIYDAKTNGDTEAKNRANHTGTQLSSTISDFSSASQTLINAVTGLLTNLSTTDKTNLVAAINEVYALITGLNAIAVSGLTSGNCITASGTSGNLGGTATGNVFILIPDDGTKSFTIQMANDATTYSPRIVFGDDSTFEIFMSDGISESVGFSFNLNTGVLELMAASANKILFPEGENTTNGDGLINKTYADKTRPIPSALTDGAAIAFDFNSKYFDLKTLTTTTTAITLTLSNVVAGANQILSVIKNTASDVTITLVGTGLSFYGYDGADYSTTPNIVLSGATGDIFDISLLARTATSIGVAVGNNGN